MAEVTPSSLSAVRPNFVEGKIFVWRIDRFSERHGVLEDISMRRPALSKSLAKVSIN
jgi:hypothetical protein